MSFVLGNFVFCWVLLHIYLYEHILFQVDSKLSIKELKYVVLCPIFWDGNFEELIGM